MMKKLFLVSLLTVSIAYAKTKKEHPPLPSIPVSTTVNLTPEQKAKVAKGELVILQKSEDLPKKRYLREGSAVFRVDARPEAVWKVLKKFEDYGDWAYKVSTVKDYKPPKGGVYHNEFRAEIIGKKYYVINDFSNMDKGYASWQTDHSQNSECVLDTVGFWRIEPVKGKAAQSEVTYVGKVILNRTCAKGFLGIGGFDGEDMAKQTYEALRERAPKAMLESKTKK